MSYSDPSLQQADLLAGSVTIVSSNSATTALTIPAGRVWKGSITLSVCDTTAAAATFTTFDVLTAGTGVQPTAGIIGRLNVHPGGTAAIEDSVSINDVVVRAPVGNSVTIQGQLSVSAATVQGSVSCVGVLVA